MKKRFYRAVLFFFVFTAAFTAFTYQEINAQIIDYLDFAPKNKSGLRKYKVTFTDELGRTIKTQYVARGMSAVAPALREREGYVLTGWDRAVNRVTRDIVTKPVWRALPYKGYAYYADGVMQRGLQKIGNKWYLFNKETGLLEQSGDKIRVGSFYNNEKEELTRFYVTLDGYNFSLVPEMGEVAGKHMNFIAEEGTFYGLKTIYRNALRAQIPMFNDTNGRWFDVGLRETTDFKDYTWHYFYDSYVEGDSLYRFSPEWFIDDDGSKYVFYSVDTFFDDFDVYDHGIEYYSIFRTEITDLVNDRSTTPTEMVFDVYPELREGDTKGGLSHPCVVKNGDLYMMFVQDNHADQADQSRGEAIWVYTSYDLTNWSLAYKINKAVLPQSPDVRTDYYGYAELDTDGNDRMFYRYYTSPFVMKLGDKWHLYADEITLGTTYRIDTEDMYSGKIVHLVSDDISDGGAWVNEGYIDAGDNRVRSGSIMVVNDETSEELIRNLYND